MFRKPPRETGALQESGLTARAVRSMVAVLTVASAFWAWRQARPGPFADRPGGVAESIRADPSFWFMAQRLSGDGRIPVRARGRALAEVGARAGPASAPGTWVGAGPLKVGGRATAVAVDPNDANRIWLGTAEGGVFRSDDAGVDWAPVFDGQTAAAIGSIAVHPADSNTVYVGTGEDNGGGFAYDGEGVFKTTDGGVTWTSLGLAEVRRIGRIAIDPAQPARLFAAARGD